MPTTPSERRTGVEALPLTRLMVYIAKEPENDPTEDDAQPFVYCTEIFLGVGDKLPYAILEVDQAALGIRIMEEYVTGRMNRRVEVWSLKESTDKDNPGQVRDRPLFWGEITSSDMSKQRAGENRILKATIEPYHFGEIAKGQLQIAKDSAGDKIQTVHLELEFNPPIEGQIKPNMAPAGNGKQNPRDYAIWLDPESVRTQTAIENFQDPPESWELDDVCKTLSAWLNPLGVPISNPIASDLAQLTTAKGVAAIKNLTLKRGGRLPDYLSTVLPPYGFQWYVEFSAGSSGIERKIVIYKRGAGADTKTIKMLPWGENFVTTKSNALDAQVRFGINSIVNKMTCHGDMIERELTIPLYPCWKNSEDSQIATSGLDNHIGRKFAANEAGDYKGLRTGIPDTYPKLFGNTTVPKKRDLEDCLTLRVDDRGFGHRRPPLIEIRNGGGAWRALALLKDSDDKTSNYHGYTVLPKEIGIWISGKIPDELLDPSTYELRITCTVKSDLRLEATKSDDSEESANSHTIEQLVDVSDRFFDRQRQSSGTYRSRFLDDPSASAADTRDDSEEIQDYAERLLTQQKGADVEASCRLWGLNHSYRLSDMISRVEGPEISFNRLAKASGEEQFLQVVGIRWKSERNSQTTELIAEPYDA